MKRFFLPLIIVVLTGCVKQGIVSGKYNKDEYLAKEACALQHNSATEFHNLIEGYYFKVTKLNDGDWRCERVYGDTLAQQGRDSRDEWLAHQNNMSLTEYREEKVKSEEKEKRGYIELYKAKERLYETYRKDGKFHSDAYVEPDGTIRSTAIIGDNRCDTVSGSSGSNAKCN